VRTFPPEHPVLLSVKFPRSVWRHTPLARNDAFSSQLQGASLQYANAKDGLIRSAHTAAAGQRGADARTQASYVAPRPAHAETDVRRRLLSQSRVM